MQQQFRFDDLSYVTRTLPRTKFFAGKLIWLSGESPGSGRHGMIVADGSLGLPFWQRRQAFQSEGFATKILADDLQEKCFGTSSVENGQAKHDEHDWQNDRRGGLEKCPYRVMRN
jgi:hypothetical protein